MKEKKVMLDRFPLFPFFGGGGKFEYVGSEIIFSVAMVGRIKNRQNNFPPGIT